MKYTSYDYKKAITALVLGETQLESDSHNCKICGDSGHQAFECQHNPLEAMRLMSGFRCFHCGRVFIDVNKAREHFGTPERETPSCMAELLTFYRNRTESLETTIKCIINRHCGICGGCKTGATPCDFVLKAETLLYGGHAPRPN